MNMFFKNAILKFSFIYMEMYSRNFKVGVFFYLTDNWNENDMKLKKIYLSNLTNKIIRKLKHKTRIILSDLKFA